MVPYTIKYLLPIKDISKTLPSSGISNYIITRKDSVLKNSRKELRKILKDKIVLICSNNNITNI